MPQRSNRFSVWRTQESGESEIRQSALSTLWPPRRPSRYHSVSAMHDAAVQRERHEERRSHSYLLPLPGLLRYLKNSEFGSSTSTSLLFLKLCLYASRLR